MKVLNIPNIKDIALSGYFIFSTFIDYSEHQVKNRRAGDWTPDPRIPKEAMRINEIAVFQTRNDQGHCKLSSSHLTVVKKVIANHFIFYAIAGETKYPVLLPEPLLTSVYFLPIEVSNKLQIYEGQIAYIVCTHGWIELLNVFPASLGANPEDPKRCGVGTLLSELCLIDPHVNRGKIEGNKARGELKKYRNAFDMSEKDCNRLVGLSMQAKFKEGFSGDLDPESGILGPWKSGGRVYLTAAKNMGYGITMVDRTPKKRINVFGYEEYEVTIYQTHIAREYYDPNSGNILPCCGKDYECKADYHNWFFCSFIPKQGKKRKHQETK